MNERERQIIALIRDKGTAYGGEIMRCCGITEGAIYGTMKRLEQKGLVVGFLGERHGRGGRRKYYRLNLKGAA